MILISEIKYGNPQNKKELKHIPQKKNIMYKKMNFVKFSCEALVEKKKADGSPGKEPVGVPRWKNKTKEEYAKMYNKKHKVKCIPTGEINDIVVVDFDNEKGYLEFVEKYPNCKEAYTVKTSKGFHIYFKYDKKIKTTTNSKLAIDIRSDGGMAFGEGTKTDFGTSYDYHCGDKIDIEVPDEFYKYYLESVDKKTKKPKKTEKTETKTIELAPEEVSVNLLDEYVECIAIEDIDNYTTWRNLVWSLNGYYETAKKMSKRSKKYEEEVFNKIYNSFKSGGITLSTFYHYAKNGDYEKYKKILDKDPNNKFIQSKTDFESIDSDFGYADMLNNICGDDFCFIDDELLIWVESEKRWFKDAKPNYRLTTNYVRLKLKEIGEKRLKEFDVTKFGEKGCEDEAKKYSKCCEKLAAVTGLAINERIVKTFLVVLSSRFDDTKFDNNPYLFCFKNCVYDFQINKFRPIKKTDYLLMNTKFDYIEPTKAKKEKIKEIIENIFPDDEVRKCYMSILRNGFSGICPEKFIISNGSGRNGKGVINDLTRSLCGDFGYKGNCDTLIDKLKSGPNPEVANLHKKRFVTYAEPDIRKNLNVSSIKDLTGGGMINARPLYSNRTETELNCVIILETNDKPDLNGTDNDSVALKERIVDVLFDSQFTAKKESEVNIEEKIFMQDPYLKTDEFKEEYRCALFDYIISYDGIENIYIPDCVANRSLNYLLGSDVIYQFVSQNTTKTDDEMKCVKLKELYDKFKGTDLYQNMDKEDKRRYNQKYFIQQISKHSQFKKYFLDICQKKALCNAYETQKLTNILWKFEINKDDSDNSDDDLIDDDDDL